VEPAYDADREPRDGARVLEVTGLLNLSGRPPEIQQELVSQLPRWFG
jgi:hypothetical protein